MLDREGWLARTLIELADTGTAEFDEADYARVFTVRLAQPLSPDEVSLFIPADGDNRDWPAVTAGSSERAVAFARLEARGVAGPCGDCRRIGHPVHAEFIASPSPGRASPSATDRWPEYASAAVAGGFAAISALPMRHHEQTIGAVGVLSVANQPLDVWQSRLARLLSEAATISILQQRAFQESLRTTRQLQRALDSRIVIEQAKGAVAAWLDISTSDAFELLRAYSRNRGRRVAEVADDVLRGELPASGLILLAQAAPRRVTSAR
ncbi:MAG: ANTAR domain-containing protein [Trebonia sp.]